MVKEYEYEITDLKTVRCVCGHLMKNHKLKINWKLRHKAGHPVNGNCKFCKCRKLSLE